jgi:hypothetical protein
MQVSPIEQSRCGSLTPIDAQSSRETQQTPGAGRVHAAVNAITPITINKDRIGRSSSPLWSTLKNIGMHPLSAAAGHGCAEIFSVQNVRRSQPVTFRWSSEINRREDTHCGTTPVMRKPLALVALSIGMINCGGGGGGGGGDTIDAPANGSDSGTDGTTHPDGASPGSKPTIFTIVLENHDYAEIVGSANAPYINSLIAMGGLATNYKDTLHPSLPNYLHMASGADQYFGVFDFDPVTAGLFPVDQPNLATQFETANIKWRSYQESMVTPCLLTATSDGLYAPKHDPFLYFTDQQSNTARCADTNVDYSKFAADLAANTYDYQWITPNLTDDGHDPSTDPVAALKVSDTWLSTEVPKILASEGFKNDGILFITWDEAEGRNGDDADKIPMINLSNRIKQAGMTSATAFTHSSYTATIEDLLKMPRLATVTASPNLMEFLK